MIIVNNLHKRFGKLTVLDGVDLVLENGGIHTILRSNGSEKTTLIKSILRMVIPNKGTIEINGNNILGTWDYRSSISYLPQIAQFPQNLKVSELFKMIKDLRKGAHSEEELVKGLKLESFLEIKIRKPIWRHQSKSKYCDYIYV